MCQLGTSQLQVVYEINFLNETENVLVSTSINLWITLCCIVALIAKVISDSIWSKYLLLSIEGMIIVVLILGFVIPNPIMVNFSNPNDFRYHYIVYIFVAFAIIGFSISFLSLFINQKRQT